MKTTKLSRDEKAYLKQLRLMERRNEPFSHAAMQVKFGWRTPQPSWDLIASLRAKGVIVDGRRFALVDTPLVSPVGLGLLGRAA